MAEKDQLLNHSYDGIKEYDNDLPRWWVQLFLVTAVGGLIYAFWFHFMWSSDPHQELAKEMTAISAMRGAQAGGAGGGQVTDAALLALSKDSSALAKGLAVYQGKCVACHGAQGGGLVGPNLTDNAWIHGGKPVDIHKTVVEGVPAKGMLAWGTMLPPEEINAVVAYIISIQGSNPPGAKAAEGQPAAS